MKYFLLKAYEGGSKVISNGSGGKFLADDGTYKTIDVSGSGLTTEQINAINQVLLDYNSGKRMSDENFTTTLKNKLDSLNEERDLEMKVNATHLQWRYVGDTIWDNLVSLDELRGFTVNTGETGQVLTKKSNTSGDWEFRQLTKNDVGLGNVQNIDTTNIDNITESSTKKIMTDTERTKLSNAFIKTEDTTDSLTEGTTKLLLTTAERNKLNNLSGVNTGDETKETIEAKLTGNITSHTHNYEPAIAAGTVSQYYRGDKTFQTLDKAAVGLSNVTNDAQIKKIASSVTDNIVTFGATTGDIVKDSGKSINNIAFKNEVNTFTKDVTIGGTLQVNGNIVQNGATYETHAEQVYTKDNTIILRDGAVAGLGAGEFAGLTAKLYDGTKDGQLVFDKNGVARVGDIGNTQAIATRENSPINGNVAVWDSTSSKFITSIGNTGTGNIVRANSPTFTGTVSGITSTMVGLGNVTNDTQVKKIANSTNNAIVRWDGVTGDTPKNSLVTISDTGSINIPSGQSYNINGTALKDIDETLTNKTLNSPIITGTPTGITASHVGLGNVPNIDTSNPANIAWTASYRTVTDTEKTTWNGKQNALGYTAENSANKKTAWQAVPDNTSYPSEKLVKDSLDLKVDKVTGKKLSTEDYTTAEKTKLSGIAVGANNYVHPVSGVTAGTYKSVTVDANGHITSGSNPTTLSGYGITDATPSSHVGSTGSSHGVVTTSVNGFMSSADKTKLDGIAVNANNYVHPTGDGNSHIPETGTTNNGKVLKAGTTANSASWGNVDWSEVANKPTTFTPTAHTHAISEVTSLQTTLDAKVSTSDVVTTATANKILKLDANAKLPASITGNADGNAATATKLQIARTINGVSFDGSANITITKIHSRGAIACETGTNKPELSGVSTQGCYANGYPLIYGEVLTLDGRGSAQLLLGWSGSNDTAPAYIRSKRDVPTSLWSDWHMIYTTAYKPSLADLGAASSSHTHAFADLTSKPTTIAGYGITDGVSTAQVSASNAASKVVQRDGSGDVVCRLVRAEYADQSTISGGLVFRTAGGSGTDNYLKVCNNISAIRTFLQVPSTAVATTSDNGLMSSTDKTKLDNLISQYLLYQNTASITINTSTTSLASAPSVGLGKTSYTAAAGKRIRIECVVTISAVSSTQIIFIYPTINGNEIGSRSVVSPTVSSGTQNHSFVFDIIFTSPSKLTCIYKWENNNIYNIENNVLGSGSFTGNIDLKLDYNVGGGSSGSVTIHHLNITYLG